MTNIEKSLKKNGIAVAHSLGDSMEPLFHTGDTVVVSSPTFPLKKYDIPVYHRDDHLTMHRIINIKNGKYYICGDNRTYIEKDITEKDIIGVVIGYYKNGNYISTNDEEYISYCKTLKKNYCIRFLRKIKNKIKRTLKGVK